MFAIEIKGEMSRELQTVFPILGPLGYFFRGILTVPLPKLYCFYQVIELLISNATILTCVGCEISDIGTTSYRQ